METTASIIGRLKSAGLTQAEIARRSGIPQPRLSKWEGGAVPTGADDALRLAALATEVEAEAAAAPRQAAGGD